MKRALFLSKEFLPLIGVAFCSAFIENAIRLLAVAHFIGSESARSSYYASGLRESLLLPSFEVGSLVLVLLVFSLPFIVLAVPAGLLSARWPRRNLVLYSMVATLLLAALFAYGMSYASVLLSLLVVFLSGLKSTILSPAKYVLVKDMLPGEQHGEGVAYLLALTTLGVLLGSFYAVLWLMTESGSEGAFGQQGLLCLFVLIALFGVLFAVSLRDSGGSAAEVAETESSSELASSADSSELGFSYASGFWRPIIRLWSEDSLSARYLLLAVLGLMLFWSLASVQQISIAFTATAFSWPPLLTAVLMGALALGICYGAILAARASAARVELGLLPISMILLAVAHGGIGLGELTYGKYFPLLFLMGFGGSFLAIPCYAYVLEKSPQKQEPIAIAVANAVIHVGLLGSVLILGASLRGQSLTPVDLYWYSGLACCGLIFCLLYLVPGIFLRFVNWCLVHTLYRLRVFDVNRVPAEGGALLVCNHLSFVDAMLVLASIDRPVRFLMYRPIYENRFIHPFAKAMGAIPVEAGRSREEIEKALSAASEGIRNGELVCIFAEGGISRVGRLLPFKRGLERIMAEVSAPIIPVYLDQIWGSVFSYRGGRFFWKRPKAIPLPVSVHFGEALPSDSSAVKVRAAVQLLAADAFKRRPLLARDLRRALLESLTRRRFSTRVSDSLGISLKAYQLLAGIALFRRQFDAERGERIGICLPPTVAAVVANLSAVCSGKVPVNLNYTASEDGLQSALRQADIRRVITSKAFCKKIGLSFSDSGAEVLYLEDISAQSSGGRKLCYGVASALLPRALLFRLVCGQLSPAHDDKPLAARDSAKDSAGDSDDVVAQNTENEVLSILFSSGSTGEPKGIMLSHKNVSSNIISLLDLLDLDNKDALLGVLPFFHSFGHTATLWYPLIAGIPVVYHSNPLDARTIGRLIDSHGARVLFATPTFLKMYLRKGKSEHFSQLRFLVVGAERLSDSVREDCQEKFALEPLEGYGCTELSPLAIVNIPDIQHGKIKQQGSKVGTVGTPIPGVLAKVVDPEDFSELEIGEEGMLLIKGSNVMLGYLNQEEKTAEVVKDGWYVTGDIARIDSDGFIAIVGRLSRFAKIAGEMIPLGRIEESILAFSRVHSPPSDEADEAEAALAIAVCSAPDQKKGEKLVVLSVQELNPSAVADYLKEQGFPNLWIPARENFHVIEEIPQLGSGKRDLKALDAIARSL